MQPLYSIDLFNSSKYTDKLPLQCKHCTNTFYKAKEQITQALKPNPKKKLDFCSLKCYGAHLRSTHSVTLKCANCQASFSRANKRVGNPKNNFCSKTCTGNFLWKNRKVTGYNRSKLEFWIEEQLRLLYPNLHIEFNYKGAINHELDIYIPSLALAFELNGIFHYEPIFGKDRLEASQQTDASKTKACIDAGIDLCVIDTTTQRYFKAGPSHKFLTIIIQIINQRTS